MGETEVDDDMTQYSVYENVFSEISFRIEDGVIEADIQVKEDTSDSFKTLWSGFGA